MFHLFCRGKINKSIFFSNCNIPLEFSLQVALESDLCQKCGEVEPESGGDLVDFVQCDICDKWYHSICVNYDKASESSFACCNFSL